MNFWLGFITGGFLGFINGIFLITLVIGGKDERKNSKTNRP